MMARNKFPKPEYPFSDELCNFLDAHPEFFNSLKLSKPGRFEFIKLIFTSHTTPPHPMCSDEVIGMWYYDKSKPICKSHNCVCLFKQDFVVNKNHLNKEFVSYSTGNNDGVFVKPIKEFFKLYGDGQNFYHDGSKWQHHYKDVIDLPDEPYLKLWAIKIKNLYP